MEPITQLHKRKGMKEKNTGRTKEEKCEGKLTPAGVYRHCNRWLSTK